MFLCSKNWRNVCVFSHAGGAAGRAQQVERLPHHQGDEKRFITLV